MTMILLTGGTVYDGSGRPPEIGSVLIDRERIRAVGRMQASSAMQEVDCCGLAIAPGFIDVHSHSDLEVLEHRAEKIRQGVTAEVVGNCGFSLFPAIEGVDLVPSFDIFERRGSRTWTDAREYFEDLDRAGSRTNVGALTGHASLRGSVMGMGPEKADAATLERMQSALEESLEQGSLGLSTGLNEVPSSYADLDELTELCKVVERHDALYTSHLRDYKFHLLEAVDEALELGRRTGVAVELSHLQAVGRKNWHVQDVVLEHVEKARSQGVEVGIDAYPYLAGSCHLTQILPTWALAGGTAALMDRLRNPETRGRIAAETDEGMANTWHEIVIAWVAGNAHLVGKTIKELADERSCAGVETALSLLQENEGRLRIISFNQSEENLRKVLTHPLNVVITDGLWTEGKPHPRTFGTYPLFLGRYVRDLKWMTLSEAINKVTALPAKRFRLKDRGEVRAGCFADLTVFDPERIGTASSYMEPDQLPQGIAHVMVNGSWAVRDGELQALCAGQPLRHGT
jgi:N-acyl-D-amino-acid deacylase